MKLSILARKKLEGYGFILPGFVYVLALLGYPLIYNFILAVQNVNVKTFKNASYVFVGLENFRALFADATFRLALKNTMTFTLGCLIFQFTIGFLLALFFSRKFTLAGPIRGLLLVGWMLPMSVTALLGKNMFDVSSGVLNDLFLRLGLISSNVEWLLNGKTAMIAIIAVNCWVGIPFNMLLLTSGLTNIPGDVIEAAQVDGANTLQRFSFITLPLMRNAIFALLMLGFIYTFKAFDLMFVMTSGGPLNATDVLATYSYTLSFKQYEFSLGSATALVLFGCLLVVGIFYLILVAREDKHEN